jgi:hypothetical protein
MTAFEYIALHYHFQEYVLFVILIIVLHYVNENMFIKTLHDGSQDNCLLYYGPVSTELLTVPLHEQ